MHFSDQQKIPTHPPKKKKKTLTAKTKRIKEYKVNFKNYNRLPFWTHHINVVVQKARKHLPPQGFSQASEALGPCSGPFTPAPSRASCARAYPTGWETKRKRTSWPF